MKHYSSTRALRVLLFALAYALSLPAAALSARQSLASAARELSHGPAATRAAFVEAAVAELTAAHRALAAQAARAGKKGQGWGNGTQPYVARLQRAAAAARGGAQVRLVVERDRSLRVVVGARPARQFMIAAPRAAGRAALEHAILRRLCAADSCTLPPAGAPLNAVLSPAPRATPPATPPAPRLVERLPGGDDGLRCAQDGVRHQVLYDNACQALLVDARALLSALHAAARRGVSIDWNMPARPREQGKAQVLAVNGSGGTITASMPTLAAAPELLIDLLPWAHARVMGIYQVLALRPPASLIYGAAVAAR